MLKHIHTSEKHVYCAVCIKQLAIVIISGLQTCDIYEKNNTQGRAKLQYHNIILYGISKAVPF